MFLQKPRVTIDQMRVFYLLIFQFHLIRFRINLHTQDDSQLAAILEIRNCSCVSREMLFINTAQQFALLNNIRHKVNKDTNGNEDLGDVRTANQFVHVIRT